MGVIFDEPKYPVIDKAPGFWKTVGNFSIGDYTTFAVTSGFCAPFGYFVGTPSSMRMSSMWAGLTLGATAGFIMAYQNSAGVAARALHYMGVYKPAGRLMGLKPNDKEVETGLAKR